MTSQTYFLEHTNSKIQQKIRVFTHYYMKVKHCLDHVLYQLTGRENKCEGRKYSEINKIWTKIIQKANLMATVHEHCEMPHKHLLE